jgi:pimeloyl-[acyl-carrier protein] methyl ester esterase
MTPQPRHLVLLPGLDGTGDLFAGFVRALPETFAVTIVRYPPDRCLSYADLVPLIEAELPTHPYILVAESFSVPLALRIAGSSAPGLRALILCAGFATSPVSGAMRHLYALLAPVVFALPLLKFADEYFLIGAKAPSALRSPLHDALSKVERRVLVHRLRDVLACDVTAEMACIDVPMLYVQATDDRLVGKGSFETMQCIRPKLAVAVVPGPHLILQREPERCAKAITVFVDSHSYPESEVSG